MGTSIEKKIIDAILKSKLVDEAKLKSVLDKEQKEGNIIKLLAASNVISGRDLLAILCKTLDLSPIDVSRIVLDPCIMDLIPEKLIRRYNVVPLSRVGNILTLVVSDPTDFFAMDDIKTVTGCDVGMVLATRSDLEKIIQSYYSGDERDIATIIDESEEDESGVEVVESVENLDLQEITEESKAAPIVKMVDLMISEVIKKRASDIHIEPQEDSLRIRYRIDGKLYDTFNLPKKNQNAVLARIKIMSNLDVTENRIPQDGRFQMRSEGTEIDFRVSSLPSSYGNKIVLRALDKGNLSVGLDKLGFLPGPLADFQKALSMPFGIILVTGPTGSGKSTTLYSILNKLNGPERNIITVEDPVEYQVEGITQIAARPEIGLDFANGLRAILRQSPDIIMVGEIRDFETADIAVKASLTGQMVLSTLHTNDSVGAITRLVNMKIEPFLISSSLIMACAQRLLRRICPHCKAEAKIPKDVLKDIRTKYPEECDVKKFYEGRGCPKCNNTGYRGRMGTLETLLVDNEIRGMINSRQSEAVIKDYLRSKDVKTLRENAMTKFFKGWTTLEEVLRVS